MSRKKRNEPFDMTNENARVERDMLAQDKGYESHEAMVSGKRRRKKTGTGVVRCDEDVLEYLTENALPFESLRAVLRRLLGFPPKVKLAPGPSKQKGRKP